MGQKELHPNRPYLELEHTTEIKWCSKSDSVGGVLSLYDAILETLAEFAESSGHTKVDIESFLQQFCHHEPPVPIYINN